MAKFNQNIKAKYEQYKNLGSMISIVVIVVGVLISLFSESSTSSLPEKKETSQFSGVIDDSFSDADVESALTSQQQELADVRRELANTKAELLSIKSNITHANEKNTHEVNYKSIEEDISKKIMAKFGKPSAKGSASNKALTPVYSLPTSNQVDQYVPTQPKVNHRLNKTGRINSVSYPFYKHQAAKHKRNPSNYVPSGTFVKAVVLGGADADASVNSQKSNHGVMLFKLISEGTLPNNRQSHLKGCFVTGSAYGDISSERAYIELDHISCAQKNRPILDKAIIGWAFFGGKVGIKGQPLMRDGKIVQWAGISGALSGIAGAAQYAQSVQNFSTLGASSVVPGNRIAAYSGLGGASKAADQLSSYYIKRAEQYHPVIQVGAGNVVNIVFRNGFSLNDDDEDEKGATTARFKQAQTSQLSNETGIPEDIINRIQNGQASVSLGGQLNNSQQG